MSDEENRETITPIEHLLIKYPNGNSIRQGWSPQCESYPATVGKWGVLKTTAIQTDGFRGCENKQLPDKLNAKEHLTDRVWRYTRNLRRTSFSMWHSMLR